MEQLTKHIQLIHSKSGHYKTTLYSANPLYYNVVTRVNYLTALLWMDYINSILKSNPKLDYEPFKKVNWLIMIKSYRRDFKTRILKQISNRGC